MAEDKGNEDIQALRNEIKRLRQALTELTPSTPPVLRLEKELFQIWNRTFIINSKDSIAGNIEKVLSWHFRSGQKVI